MLMSDGDGDLLNRRRGFIDDDLELQGVGVLFATIEGTLVFLGRSMGTSLASSSTTGRASGTQSTGLTSANRPEAAKRCSTRFTMRYALDSWTP